MFNKPAVTKKSSALRQFISLVLMIFYFLPLQAQDVPPKDKNDLALLNFSDSVPNPKKAMIYSTLLPGLGQAYNKKYWKIPVIYAGFTALAYSYSFYNSQYNIYKQEYIFRQINKTASKPELGNFSSTYIDNFRRYRDYSFIGLSAFFILNIVDAGVDAHLTGFDVNENLSVHYKPYYSTDLLQSSFNHGASLKLKF